MVDDEETRTLISVDLAFDASSAVISSMSSTGFSLVLSFSRMVSSKAFSSLRIVALEMINVFFISSKSGRSSATTRANI